MPILTRQFNLGVHAATELVRGQDRAVLLGSGHPVVAIDLLDGTTRELATGHNMPGGIAVSRDGEAFYVMDLDPAQTQFTLYQVELSDLRDGPELGPDRTLAKGARSRLALLGRHSVARHHRLRPDERRGRTAAHIDRAEDGERVGAAGMDPDVRLQPVDDPASQTVTLNAVEAGAPPAGQFAGAASWW
jgi:hypothetical protein